MLWFPVGNIEKAGSEGPDRELTAWLRDTTGLPIGTIGDESPADSFSPLGSRADRAGSGGLLQYFFGLSDI